MEKVNLYCDDCGIAFSPDAVIFERNNNSFYCEECFHERVIDTHWYSQVSLQDIIHLLNQADYHRMTSFYVSFVGGKNPYVISKEAYPSVFCVLSSRDELVRIIESKKEH